MMRILLIGINFYPEIISTGKYTSEMAVWLAKAGYEVRVVTAPPYYPWWQVQSPYRWWQYHRERWQGIDVWRSPLWVPKRVSGMKRVLHLASFALFSAPLVLWQVLWRPNVVLVVAPALSSAPLGWLVARLSGAKAWLHIQDFEVDAALNLGILKKTWLSRALRAFERRLLQVFDVVSSISSRMCERLQEKGVSPERLFFFPNWVDTESIYPLTEPGNPLRAALGLRETDVVVLYSGNMGEKQGLEILVEVARSLQDRGSIHFVLCGEGAVREQLLAKAADLPNVHFLPLQPTDKLNVLLNLADIHVLPQRADAADLVMPSKLSGMLASGRAVIATAHPDTEVGRVVAQAGQLVPPEDAQALMSAICELADAPHRREELGMAGRRYAELHYSRQQILDRFLQKLKEVGGENEINRV